MLKKLLSKSQGHDSSSYLLVGLGNPGAEYKGHRHNIGFMMMDRLASDYQASAFKSKFQGEITQAQIDGVKAFLLKPQTYMNNSGQSVQAAAKFYSIPPERIIVFYDELDLPLGKIRVRQGGGTGGHNGIKSLDAHLPSKSYWRVRLGIGHPGDKEKVTGYVLSNFAKAEQSLLEDILYYGSKYAPLLLSEHFSDYMTRLSEALKK